MSKGSPNDQLDWQGILSSLTWNTFVGGSANDSVNGVAVDGAGNTYVTGTSAGTWGTPIRAFGGGTGDAFVAKFDSSGNLFVSSFNTGAISKVVGTTVSSFGNVSNALGLAFNPVTGSLLVASQGGSSIYEIGAGGGSSSQFAYFGGDSPQYVAFAPSAIPEPSTYAALAGAAVLGLAVWRRRRAKSAPATAGCGKNGPGSL